MTLKTYSPSLYLVGFKIFPVIFTTLVPLAVTNNSAKAASPVAIIEEITSNQEQYGPMDFLFEGTEITLNPTDILILGYLTSCLQEKITGGTVRIGLEKSYVDHGTTVTKLIPCEGGALNLTEEQSGKSGVLVFRKTPKKTRLVKTKTTNPAFYIRLADNDTFPILTIKHLPSKRNIHKIKVTHPMLDLKHLGIILQNDTKYQATLGPHSLTFITPTHTSEKQDTSILSRIIIFKR